MTNLIGNILNGSVAGEDATFKIIDVREDGGDTYVVAECVEFGAPHQKININNINKPVRA